MKMISGPEVLPKSHKPSSVVILLHGYGADGEGLIGLARAFSHALPDTYFVAPNAILPFEHNSSGYQWCSLKDMNELVLVKGLDEAAPYVNEFIEYQLKRFNLLDNKLALVGFSQGAILSLHLALRRAKPLAGIVGLSGMIVAPHLLKTEAKSKPPVTLIHGMLDDVMPVAALTKATSALQEQNIAVESLAEPGIGHWIGEEGFKFAAMALKRYLDA